jgi:small subunit ribosomal protein S2
MRPDRRTVPAPDPLGLRSSGGSMDAEEKPKGAFMSQQPQQQVVTMKQLLEAGVHFGHQTKRWNPKMKSFIFQERNGIYILDLQQTLKLTIEAHEHVRNLVKDGGKIIFVGTKKQASDSIKEEAERCEMPYINQRWLGGLFTNFRTISSRIEQLRIFEADEEAGKFDQYSKKEAKMRRTELHKLQKYLGGVRNMKSIPEAMFIVDLRKEYIAFLEAKKMGLKVFAVVDTNVDPTGVDYPIPGNDDAIRAVRLLSKVIADAVIAGRAAAGITETDFAASEQPEEAGVEAPDAAEQEEILVPEPEAAPSAGRRHGERRRRDEGDSIDLRERGVFDEQ